MLKNGILLYCIAKDLVTLNGLKGLDQIHDLTITVHRGLFCIVSQISLDEYSEESINEKSEDLNWITKQASKFMEIMSALNKETTIIPMKFLTIFKSEERLLEEMDKNYDSIKDTLNYLEQRNEYNIKIYCNHKRFKELGMTQEIKDFEDSLNDKPKGAAFYLKKKFNDELDEKAEHQILLKANEIVDLIKEKAIDFKSNKLLAKELTGVVEKMILNCAFLVNKDKEEDFLLYVNELVKKYVEVGFKIDITGPWPPYNFCS